MHQMHTNAFNKNNYIIKGCYPSPLFSLSYKRIVCHSKLVSPHLPDYENGRSFIYNSASKFQTIASKLKNVRGTIDKCQHSSVVN